MFSRYYIKSTRIKCKGGEIEAAQETVESATQRLLQDVDDDISLLDYINSENLSEDGLCVTESSYNVQAGSSNKYLSAPDEECSSSSQNCKLNQDYASPDNIHLNKPDWTLSHSISTSPELKRKKEILFREKANKNNNRKHHRLSQICRKLAGKMKIQKDESPMITDGHASDSPESVVVFANTDTTKRERNDKGVAESGSRNFFRLLSKRGNNLTGRSETYSSDIPSSSRKRIFRRTRNKAGGSQFSKKYGNYCKTQTFDKVQQERFSKFQGSAYANNKTSIFDLFYHEMKVRPDNEDEASSVDDLSMESGSTGIISYYTEEQGIWQSRNSARTSNSSIVRNSIFRESPDLHTYELGVPKNRGIRGIFEDMLGSNDEDIALGNVNSSDSSAFSFVESESDAPYQNRNIFVGQDNNHIVRDEDGISTISLFFGIFRSNTDGHIRKASRLRSLIRGLKEDQLGRSLTLRYYGKQNDELSNSRSFRLGSTNESEIIRAVRERFENGLMSPLPNMVLKYSRSMRNMVYSSKTHRSNQDEETSDVSIVDNNKKVRNRVGDSALMAFGDTVI